MKVRVLGCHGGTSLHHRNVSLLVDETLALEAGSLASGTTVEEQLELEVVLLSHCHLDHVAELGAVCDLRAQRDRPPLRVLASAETIEALRRHYFNDVIWPDFTRIAGRLGPTVVLEAVEPEAPFRAGALEVRAVPVEHTVPSCGFVLADAEASFGYTGDTGPTRRFWELAAAAADLRAVVTEASFPSRLEAFALQTGHMTPAMVWERVRELARRPGLGLFVYGMKPAHVEEIERELRHLTAGAVRPLVAGQVLDLAAGP